MALALGTRLGSYEVISALGAGGMGEVYRASDSRLGREVAIKVIPGDFLEDEDRRARFEREARTLATLNHPSIASIYSFEEISGLSLLVMELLEGETLRARLAGGALPVRKAVDFAVQIARALAAAHEKGVVHRDLKPENLFVTKDGRIKVLDFGLAKLVETGAAGGTNLPTMSKGTEPGAVLGTLGYMSPEQLRGLPADHRTDLFSFGAVLYEMLAGRKAFRGDTAADTVSAILREEPPDLSATNRAIPPALERIVRHCLEKSPDERAHSAHDLAFDLESLSTASSGSAAAPRAAVAIRRPSARALATAVACLVAGLAAGRFLWTAPVPGPPTFHRLTFRRGNVLAARFAPDGRTVVYGAAWGARPSEIFTVRTEGPESRPLGLANASVLAVSSSGELAILTREGLAEAGSWGTLARVPLSGGAPRALLEEVTAADWTPDGKDLAVIRNRENGGRRVELPAGKTLYETPRRLFALRVSPDGSSIAVAEIGDGEASLLLLDRAGKVRMLAGPMSVFSGRFAWSPSGREIWYFGGSDRKDAALRAVDLAGRIRTLYRSTGTLFVHDIFPDGRVLLEHAAGVRGIMFGRAGDKAETELSWFDGSSIAAVAAGGRAILFNEGGEALGGRLQAFFRKTDGSPAVRLGDGEALALSPDATRVILRAGDTLTIAPVGTGTPVPVALGPLPGVTTARFFPDGRRLLLHGAEKGKPARFWIVEPGGMPRPISPEGTLGSADLISPDGRRVIGWSADTSILSVVSTEGAPTRTLAGTEYDEPIGWMADGRSIYIRPSPGQKGRIGTLDVDTLVRKPWKELVPPDAASVTSVPEVVFAPDGSAYSYTYQRVLTSDLYVVEGLR